MLQASVSLKRIQCFLSHDELDPDSVDKKNIASGRHLFKPFNLFDFLSLNCFIPIVKYTFIVKRPVGLAQTGLEYLFLFNHYIS